MPQYNLIKINIIQRVVKNRHRENVSCNLFNSHINQILQHSLYGLNEMPAKLNLAVSLENQFVNLSIFLPKTPAYGFRQPKRVRIKVLRCRGFGRIRAAAGCFRFRA